MHVQDPTCTDRKLGLQGCYYSPKLRQRAVGLLRLSGSIWLCWHISPHGSQRAADARQLERQRRCH